MRIVDFLKRWKNAMNSGGIIGGQGLSRENKKQLYHTEMSAFGVHTLSRLKRIARSDTVE